MLKKKLTLVNEHGLHIRAATKFINKATRYASHIEIVHGTQSVNGKSIMGVMSLGAKKDTEIELIIEGEDEATALSDLEELILNRFGDRE